MEPVQDYYAKRANGAMNFLCGARSDAGRELRKEVLYEWCARLAQEHMRVFQKQHEGCQFYAEAVATASDALWWTQYSVVEAKRHLAKFYRLLDEVVEEHLVPPKRT